MDFGSKLAVITAVFAFTFVLNLYFGHKRGKTKRYSFKWFLWIHLPIPFVIIARFFSQLDFRYIPLLVFAAITGQLLGGKLEF